MIDLIARFPAERPTPDGTSPAALFLGRRTRLAFEPRRDHVDTQDVDPPTRQADPTAGHQCCGSCIFHKDDTVRVRRPACATRKGQSPYSGVLTVTAVRQPGLESGQHPQVRRTVVEFLRHRTDACCRSSCRTQTTQTTDGRPTSSSILPRLIYREGYDDCANDIDPKVAVTRHANFVIYFMSALFVFGQSGWWLGLENRRRDDCKRRSSSSRLRRRDEDDANFRRSS